jgi:epoxyqueuosine reductase
LNPRARLFHELRTFGYNARVAMIDRLNDLQEDIESLHQEGRVDEEFYGRFLTGFVFSPPEGLPQACSLIVVAVPQPQIRFTFTWKGQRLPFIVPPTYLHWRETVNHVEEVLLGALEAGGYAAVQAELPKKLLAARSGLATYGRNNVTYVSGMGSFHRLVAFISDLPCEKDEWRVPRMMERCSRCGACLRNCPTGAISGERFLLHAERCISLHNEEPTQVPFPAWVDPSWHNCLVGCLHCQRGCPENQRFLDRVEEGAEFTFEETTLLVEGTSLGQLPVATVDKLKRSDLVDLLEVLPRNLKVLLKRSGERSDTL